MAHHKRVTMDEAANTGEEEGGANQESGEKKMMMGGNQPRGINRLSSIIKCLINCTPEATSTHHFLTF